MGKRRRYIFPAVALSVRAMFKEYFGFWFECPYILFPLLGSYALCGVTVLAGELPDSPAGSDAESVKV